MMSVYYKTGSFSCSPIPLSWYSPSSLLHQSSLAFLLEAILNKSDHICPQSLSGPARDMMPDQFGVCLMFCESSMCLCFPEETQPWLCGRKGMGGGGRMPPQE